MSYLVSLILASTLTMANDMPREQTTEVKDASFVAEVGFSKNSSELSADGQAQVRNVLGAAQVKGAIEEVKVLAWADGDYPRKDKLSKEARKLADDRASEIKGFLEDNTKDVDIDLYNMAERPAELEKLLNTTDARVKRSLESAGVTKHKLSKAKGSRALVLFIVK